MELISDQLTLRHSGYLYNLITLCICTILLKKLFGQQIL